MNNLVEIVNLTKKYGTNVAVNHLTVSLPKGKIIGLLGPNGSGKTTLIKMLNGLLTPTEGTILIDGNNVGPATKSKVAYLPDRTYLTMNKNRVLSKSAIAEHLSGDFADKAFLYSCQQMLFFLRFHVCLNWMENC